MLMEPNLLKGPEIFSIFLFDGAQSFCRYCKGAYALRIKQVSILFFPEFMISNPLQRKLIFLKWK